MGNAKKKNVFLVALPCQQLHNYCLCDTWRPIRMYNISALCQLLK